MAFSFTVELLNMTMMNRKKKRRIVEFNEPKLQKRMTGADDTAH
jgi:hypothetical protein